MRLPSQVAARNRRAEAAFRLFRGAAATARRRREIAALPQVPWRGLTLYTLRCGGEFGRGPHDVNVPEQLAWSLISLDRFLCPFHR